MNTNPVVRVKRSLVQGKVPTTTQLGLGELAINHYDGKLFIRQDTQGVGVGTTVIAVNQQGPQGAQGAPGNGSSTAAAYIESPDGSTRYPIYSFNNANWVKIDGNVYQITGQTLTPQVVNLGYQLMYASSDCSGHPKQIGRAHV